MRYQAFQKLNLEHPSFAFQSVIPEMLSLVVILNEMVKIKNSEKNDDHGSTDHFGSVIDRSEPEQIHKSETVIGGPWILDEDEMKI